MSEAPGHEMPFLDHLEELRKRLFWVAGAILIGIVVGFALLSRLDIIRLLERPILPLLNGQKLIYNCACIPDAGGRPAFRSWRSTICRSCAAPRMPLVRSRADRRNPGSRRRRPGPLGARARLSALVAR